MTDWSNPDQARAALADPRLPDFELAAIAAVHPALWPQVAAHPAAYPDLLSWLAGQGVPIPPRHPGPAPVQPPQGMPAPGFGAQVAPQGPPALGIPHQAVPQQGPPIGTPLQAVAQQAPPQATPPVGMPLQGMPPQGQPQFAPAMAPQPGTASLGMPSQPTPAAEAAPGGRRRLVLVAAAAVLLLGGGAGAWALTQAGGAPDGWRPTNVRTVPPGTPADVGR